MSAPQTDNSVCHQYASALTFDVLEESQRYEESTTSMNSMDTQDSCYDQWQRWAQQSYQQKEHEKIVRRRIFPFRAAKNKESSASNRTPRHNLLSDHVDEKVEEFMRFKSDCDNRSQPSQVPRNNSADWSL